MNEDLKTRLQSYKDNQSNITGVSDVKGNFQFDQTYQKYREKLYFLFLCIQVFGGQFDDVKTRVDQVFEIIKRVLDLNSKTGQTNDQEKKLKSWLNEFEQVYKNNLHVDNFDAKGQLNLTQLNVETTTDSTNRKALRELIDKLKGQYQGKEDIEQRVFDLLYVKLDIGKFRGTDENIENLLIYSLIGHLRFHNRNTTDTKGPFMLFHDKIYQEGGSKIQGDLKTRLDNKLNDVRNPEEAAKRNTDLQRPTVEAELLRKIYYINKIDVQAKGRKSLQELKNDNASLQELYNQSLQILQQNGLKDAEVSNEPKNSLRLLAGQLQGPKTYIQVIDEISRHAMGSLVSAYSILKNTLKFSDGSPVQNMVEFMDNISKKNAMNKVDKESYAQDIEDMQNEVDMMFKSVQTFNGTTKTEMETEIAANKNAVESLEKQIKGVDSDILTKQSELSTFVTQTDEIKRIIQQLEVKKTNLIEHRENLLRSVSEEQKKKQTLAGDGMIEEQMRALNSLIQEKPENGPTYIFYHKIKSLYNRATELYNRWKKDNKVVQRQELERAIPDDNPIQKGYLPHVNNHKIQSDELAGLKSRESDLLRRKREAKKRAWEVKRNMKCLSPFQKIARYMSPNFDDSVFDKLKHNIQNSRDLLDHAQILMMSDLKKDASKLRDDMKLSRSNVMNNNGSYVIGIENMFVDSLYKLLDSIQKRTNDYRSVMFYVFNTKLKDPMNYLEKWEKYPEFKKQLEIYEEDVTRTRSMIKDMKDNSSTFFSQTYLKQVTDEIALMEIDKHVLTPSVQSQLRKELERVRQKIMSVNINTDRSRVLKEYATDRQFIWMYVFKFINFGVWAVVTQVMRMTLVKSFKTLVRAVNFGSLIYLITSLTIYGILYFVMKDEEWSMFTRMFLSDCMMTLVSAFLIGQLVAMVIQRPYLFRFTTEKDQATKIMWYILTLLHLVPTLCPLFLI